MLEPGSGSGLSAPPLPRRQGCIRHGPIRASVRQFSSESTFINLCGNDIAENLEQACWGSMPAASRADFTTDSSVDVHVDAIRIVSKSSLRACVVRLSSLLLSLCMGLTYTSG